MIVWSTTEMYGKLIHGITLSVVRIFHKCGNLRIPQIHVKGLFFLLKTFNSQEFIEEIKKEIQKQRVSIVMNANRSMICLYWNIGKAILKKQEEEGWGAKVIDRMSKDLKIAFPEMSGFSPRNIKYMRKFAQC